MSTAAIAAAVALAPTAFAFAWLKAPATPLTVPLAAVETTGGWTAAAGSVDESWQPFYGVTDGDARLTFERARDGARVDVFVAFYATQRQDVEAVNDRNKPFGSAAWERYALRAVTDRVALAEAVPGEEFLLREKEGRGRRLVWRTHWVNGAFVVAPMEAKIQQLMALISVTVAASAAFLVSVIWTGLPLASYS